nr:hypothetical protein [Candidatus Njordarchaeum guaymaensis]
MVTAGKIDVLEKEIRSLTSLVLVGKDALLERKLVSLRGMGKLLVSEKELDQFLMQAKKTLFKDA